MELKKIKYEDEILKLVSELDNSEKKAIISKIVNTIPELDLEDIYTEEFIMDMKEIEDDVRNGRLIKVGSLSEYID